MRLLALHQALLWMWFAASANIKSPTSIRWYYVFLFFASLDEIAMELIQANERRIKRLIGLLRRLASPNTCFPQIVDLFALVVWLVSALRHSIDLERAWNHITPKSHTHKKPTTTCAKFGVIQTQALCNLLINYCHGFVHNGTCHLPRPDHKIWIFIYRKKSDSFAEWISIRYSMLALLTFKSNWI